MPWTKPAIKTRRPAATLVWENVPGVLNDRSNFWAFPGALAESRPAARGSVGARWLCVWTRRRMFRRARRSIFRCRPTPQARVSVASGGDDLDPAGVLFERDGLRGDSSPAARRGKDASYTAGHGAAAGGYAGLKRPHGKVTITFVAAVAIPQVPSTWLPAWTAAPGPKNDFEVETFLRAIRCRQQATHYRSVPPMEARAAAEDGTGKGVPIIAFTAQGSGGCDGELSTDAAALVGDRNSRANAWCQPSLSHKPCGELVARIRSRPAT